MKILMNLLAILYLSVSSLAHASYEETKARGHSELDAAEVERMEQLGALMDAGEPDSLSPSSIAGKPQSYKPRSNMNVMSMCKTAFCLGLLLSPTACHAHVTGVSYRIMGYAGRVPFQILSIPAGGELVEDYELKRTEGKAQLSFYAAIHEYPRQCLKLEKVTCKPQSCDGRPVVETLDASGCRD